VKINLIGTGQETKQNPNGWSATTDVLSVPVASGRDDLEGGCLQCDSLEIKNIDGVPVTVSINSRYILNRTYTPLSTNLSERAGASSHTDYLFDTVQLSNGIVAELWMSTLTHYSPTYYIEAIEFFNADGTDGNGGNNYQGSGGTVSGATQMRILLSETATITDATTQLVAKISNSLQYYFFNDPSQQVDQTFTLTDTVTAQAVYTINEVFDTQDNSNHISSSVDVSGLEWIKIAVIPLESAASVELFIRRNTTDGQAIFNVSTVEFLA